MAKNAMPVSKAKTAYGLLSEIRKLILEEPRRYDQSTWRMDLDLVNKSKVPACGSICCVAGWVEQLKYKRVTNPNNPAASGFSSSIVFKRARKQLGISERQAEELFTAHAIADINPILNEGTPEYAEAGAAHIEAFQKKYAKQLKAKRV